MNNESGMNFQESLALLNELNLIEWLSRDVEESTRLIVNAMVSELLETTDPLDYRPSSPSDSLLDVFTDHGWDIDWFELASGRFFEAVELNAQSIGFGISDNDSMLTDGDAKQAVLTFAKEWEAKLRSALKQAIDGTTRS